MKKENKSEPEEKHVQSTRKNDRMHSHSHTTSHTHTHARIRSHKCTHIMYACYFYEKINTKLTNKIYALVIVKYGQTTYGTGHIDSNKT